MAFWTSGMDDLDAIGRFQEQRATAYRQAQQVTIDQVNQANTIQRNYPWLPPGASYAFAVSGLDDETVHRVASSALQGQTQNTALGLNQPGDVVNADVEAGRSAKQKFLDNWISSHEHSSALASASDVFSSGAGDVGHFIANNPVSKVFATGDNPLANALRGATRGVTSVLDAPGQFVQGAYREASTQIRNEGFGSLIHGESMPTTPEEAAARPGPLAQTDIGQTVSNLVHGQGVDQGSGFFVNPASGIGQQKYAAEAKYGQIQYADGTWHNRSIGRDAASAFFEPGTKPWQILSGVTDAGVRVASDLPVQHAVSIGHAATEFKSIDYGLHATEETSTLQKVRDAVGIIANPGRRATYDPQALENWLPSHNGIATAEHFANSDAYDIYKSAPKLPGELVGALAKAETPDEVRNVLRASLGQGAESLPTTAVGRYGNIVKKTIVPEPLQEMLNRLPGRFWDSYNPTDALRNADRKMDLYHLDEEVKRPLFNAMAAVEHVPDSKFAGVARARVNFAIDHAGFDKALEPYVQIEGLPEGFNVVGKDLKGKYLSDINQGMSMSDVGDVQALTAAQRDAVNVAREKAKQVREIFMPSAEGRVEDQTIYNMTGGGTNLSWQDATINNDGKVEMANSPQPWWLSEFHGRMVPNPDIGAVKSELSAIAPLLNDQGLLKGTTYLHYVQQKIWKTIILSHPAVAARIIGDAQGRMYASGYAGLGSDPLDMVSLIVGDGKLAQRFGMQGALKTGPAGDVLADADGLSQVLNTESVYQTKKAATYLPGEMDRILPHERGYHEAIAQQIGKAAYEREDPLPTMIANALQNDGSISTVKDQVWAMEDYRKKMQSIAKYRDDGVQVWMDRRFTDAIVDGSVQRIKEITGENPELIAEIANPSQMTREELIDKIKSVDQSTLPARVAGPRALTEAEKASRSSVRDRLFSTMIGAPTNKLSEVPALRQAIWGEAKALAPMLDPADAEKFIANAAEAGLSKGDLRQLTYFANKPVPGGIPDAADRLAAFKQRMAAIPRQEVDPFMGSFDVLDEFLPKKPGVVSWSETPEMAAAENIDFAGGKSWGWRDSNGELQGYLMTHVPTPGGDRIVAGLRVNPEFQGQGIAKKLYAAAAADGVRIDELGANTISESGLAARTSAVKDYLQANRGISLETLDTLAKAKGIDVMKTLFINHVEQRQFTKAIELVMPFAHHWSEFLTNWSKFLVQDPTLLHNLEYAFHETTDPTPTDSTGIGSVMGVPAGTGFLHPDPQTGKEMFTWPFSAQATKMFTSSGAVRGGTLGAIAGGLGGALVGGAPGALKGAIGGGALGVGAHAAGVSGPGGVLDNGPGIATPLTSSVQGLSLGLNVMPMLGLVGTVPLNALIPTTPEWDGVRNVIMPFGKPKSLLDIRAQLPPFMQRSFNIEDQRTAGSTTAAMVDYLGGSGKYDLHNPDPTVVQAEGNRLLSDARQASTWFTVFRGLAGSSLPSAPKPEWWFDDKTGTRIMLDTLKNDYEALYRSDPQHAVTTMMQRYGDNVMLALQGKTISVALGGGLPPTKGADQWARSNGDLARDLPSAYGFFAPRDDTKLDFSVYDRQIASGDRFQLTPEQILQEANKRVAQTVYYSVRNEMPAVLSAKQSAVMAQLRADLAARYPGYADKYGNDIVGVPNQATVGQTLTELVKASTDSRLADNAATPVLRKYLDLRNQIRAGSAKSLGKPDSWLTANGAANARAFLYDQGQKLAQSNPAFAPMWESVLYREFQNTYEKDQRITS